jgi:hypothetical protein
MRLLVLLLSIISLLFIANATADDSTQQKGAAINLEQNVECGGNMIRFPCGGRIYCAVPPAECCWGVPCGDGGTCTSNPRSPCRWADKEYDAMKQPVWNSEAKCACELYGGPFRYQHPHKLDDGRICVCNVYEGQCVLNPRKKCDYHWLNHNACG